MSDNYVECEVTLKQLFDCFNFDYTKKDEFQTIGNVQIRDENNNWIDIKKLIIKTDDIIELTFSDNTKLRAAANHIISLYPNKEIGKLVKNFEIGDFIPYKDIVVTDKRLIAVKQRVYGINVDSFKHLYKDYNGIIHRNTHEIMTTCKKYIGQNPTKAELIYEAGDIGSNMSSLIPFFYKNSDNKIIVLDDNDKMLMANCQQDIQNIMKAILDPKAEDEKPITVRSSMLGTFARSYMDMMDESIEFEIEPESLLRENRLKLWLNDNLVVNRILNPKDAKKLIEASWLNPYEDMEEDDIVEEEEEVTKKGKNGRRGRASSNEESDFKFPRKFLFNSSVIFISNLEMDQISPAVLDRCETKNIKLNLEQFLDRLGSIYGGLCNGGKNSTIPKPVRDWSKKCVYTALNLVIKAWERNVALFGKPVEINRKLTFRMFDEFVNAHFRYSLALAEKHNASLSDEHFREAISQYVLKDLISLKMLPWMATETRV